MSPSSMDGPVIAPSDIHVLLVDDERLARLVVGNLLRRCGYQVTVADGGLEAIRLLQERADNFNLILTDLMMPGIDGLQTLRFVRAESRLDAIPVIMMSSNDHQATVVECISAGAEEYLLKPVTKKEVQYIWQHVWRRVQNLSRLAEGRVQQEAQFLASSVPQWPQPESLTPLIGALQSLRSDSGRNSVGGGHGGLWDERARAMSSGGDTRQTLSFSSGHRRSGSGDTYGMAFSGGAPSIIGPRGVGSRSGVGPSGISSLSGSTFLPGTLGTAGRELEEAQRLAMSVLGWGAGGSSQGNQQFGGFPGVPGSGGDATEDTAGLPGGAWSSGVGGSTAPTQSVGGASRARSHSTGGNTKQTESSGQRAKHASTATYSTDGFTMSADTVQARGVESVSGGEGFSGYRARAGPRSGGSCERERMSGSRAVPLRIHGGMRLSGSSGSPPNAASGGASEQHLRQYSAGRSVDRERVQQQTRSRGTPAVDRPVGQAGGNLATLQADEQGELGASAQHQANKWASTQTAGTPEQQLQSQPRPPSLAQQSQEVTTSGQDSDKQLQQQATQLLREKQQGVSSQWQEQQRLGTRPQRRKRESLSQQLMWQQQEHEQRRQQQMQQAAALLQQMDPADAPGNELRARDEEEAAAWPAPPMHQQQVDPLAMDDPARVNMEEQQGVGVALLEQQQEGAKRAQIWAAAQQEQQEWEEAKWQLQQQQLMRRQRQQWEAGRASSTPLSGSQTFLSDASDLGPSASQVQQWQQQQEWEQQQGGEGSQVQAWALARRQMQQHHYQMQNGQGLAQQLPAVSGQHEEETPGRGGVNAKGNGEEVAAAAMEKRQAIQRQIQSKGDMGGVEMSGLGQGQGHSRGGSPARQEHSQGQGMVAGAQWEEFQIGREQIRHEINEQEEADERAWADTERKLLLQQQELSQRVQVVQHQRMVRKQREQLEAARQVLLQRQRGEMQQQQHAQQQQMVMLQRRQQQQMNHARSQQNSGPQVSGPSRPPPESQRMQARNPSARSDSSLEGRRGAGGAGAEQMNDAEELQDLYGGEFGKGVVGLEGMERSIGVIRGAPPGGMRSATPPGGMAEEWKEADEEEYRELHEVRTVGSAQEQTGGRPGSSQGIDGGRERMGMVIRGRPEEGGGRILVNSPLLFPGKAKMEEGKSNSNSGSVHRGDSNRFLAEKQNLPDVKWREQPEVWTAQQQTQQDPGHGPQIAGEDEGEEQQVDMGERRGVRAASVGGRSENLPGGVPLLLEGPSPSTTAETGSKGNVSLRRWLYRPGREVDRMLNLHIFRQVVEMVDRAHSQGVVVKAVMPSRFLLTTANRVMFADTAGNPTPEADEQRDRASGMGDLLTGGTRAGGSRADLIQARERLKSLGSGATVPAMSMDGVPSGFGFQEGGWGNSRGMGTRPRLSSEGGMQPPQQRLLSGSNRSTHQPLPWEEEAGRWGGSGPQGGTDGGPRSIGGRDWMPVRFGSNVGSSGSEWSDDFRAGTAVRTNQGVYYMEGMPAIDCGPMRVERKGVEITEKEKDEVPVGALVATDGRLTSGQGGAEWAEVEQDEQLWYSSPEEQEGPPSKASDIYRLGVFFFELFCTFSSPAERRRVMSDLRHRILPPRMLSENAKEAGFCLWLLHPEQTARPKARDVLSSELLSEAGEALAEWQAAGDMEETEAETEVLLDFLMHMNRLKQEAASRLTADLARLNSDIREVERRRFQLVGRAGPGEKQAASLRSEGAGGGQEAAAEGTMEEKVQEGAGQKQLVLSRKRRREDQDEDEEEEDEEMDAREREKKARKAASGRQAVQQQQVVRGGVGGPPEETKRKGDLWSKSARVMRNFEHLEDVYFSMRRTVGPPRGLESGTALALAPVEWAGPRPEGGQVENWEKPPEAGQGRSGPVTGGGLQRNPSGGLGLTAGTEDKDWLGCFFDSLCKFARYSKFEVRATLRHGDLLNTANMVCSLGFDRDEEFFATAGVCKRIKIFECDSVLSEHVDIHYPVVEMASRSKLSSICWNSYIKNFIASSDYEGIVQLWDASTSQPLMEYEEHEKRAWSVDFSRADPTRLASGSDDGCVKLWSINQDSSVATIKSKANVCCVQFPSDSAHLLAFGSADYKVYCYDLRSTRTPLCVLGGHSRAVSYVKFIDSTQLVSASTDNTLKLWDLNKASSQAGGLTSACSLTYTGHTNEKNFVGLSVADGYIACGSETNAVFAYHKSLPMPMASHRFGGADPITGTETEDDAGQFVSSVCWRGSTQTLVAANSMGNIKLLEMV